MELLIQTPDDASRQAVSRPSGEPIILAPGVDLGPTDEELLRRFARGDRAALGRLAQRYERPLLGLAMSLLAHREDLAMEAVQETWVRVIGAAKHFAGRSSVKTWLYRIAINKCHDLRAAGRIAAARNGTLASVGADEPPSAAAHAAPHKPGHDEHASALRRALHALPGERRLLLILCYHAGMTHPQAADVLGIPVGTLKSRLAAALDELRSTLAPEHAP